jgi:hypothetical protein
MVISGFVGCSESASDANVFVEVLIKLGLSFREKGATRRVRAAIYKNC